MENMMKIKATTPITTIDPSLIRPDHTPTEWTTIKPLVPPLPEKIEYSHTNHNRFQVFGLFAGPTLLIAPKFKGTHLGSVHGQQRQLQNPRLKANRISTRVETSSLTPEKRRIQRSISLKVQILRKVAYLKGSRTSSSLTCVCQTLCCHLIVLKPLEIFLSFKSLSL